ncbi:elongation factor 1-alpha C-terminal domain-related protein, partial [Escherichia coli]|uniref:elongation factor 1-alpha C-terminal domain-related protein n=1 Tax=Escherichia coli TaxID=562 RepID=UPI00130FC964
LVVMNDPGEIREGYTPLVECHASHVPCKFTELLAKYDKRSGEVVEAAPNIKMLQKGDWALVRLEPIKPMIVEPFTEFAPLGRI